MSAATILIADDDRSIRTVLSQALGRLDHEVRTTGTAANLWRWISDGEGDLVITDVVMPGVDGPTHVREVRQRYPELKVIFISGYTEDTFRDKLGAGEEVEFLSKPFTLQQLAGKVKEVLDGDGAGKG